MSKILLPYAYITKAVLKDYELVPDVKYLSEEEKKDVEFIDGFTYYKPSITIYLVDNSHQKIYFNEYKDADKYFIDCLYTRTPGLLIDGTTFKDK